MPTYYRCRTCSRITSFYPWGCMKPFCEVKRNLLGDVIWNLFIFIAVISIIFLAASNFVVNAKLRDLYGVQYTVIPR
jgi:hypothetical protein